MDVSRRDFLKTGLAGLGGLCAAAWAAKIFAAETSAAAARSASAAAPALLAPKPKVFVITEPKLLDRYGNFNQQSPYPGGVLKRLLQEMTGQREVKDAWRVFFKDTDVIGIKFDPQSAAELRTAAPLADLLASSLVEDADFDVKKIMLLDPPPFIATVNTRKPPRGYVETFVKIKDRQTQFLRAFDQCTAILNVPFIKDHRQFGLAAGMAGLALGVISNPGVFAANGGDPGVAELAACGEIRSRHRLTIVNAVRGIYDGGPRPEEAKMWNQTSLLAGTDPVAVDTVALDLLDAARYTHGLKSLKETGRTSAYLKTAAGMGLGQCEMNRIDLRRLNP